MFLQRVYLKINLKAWEIFWVSAPKTANYIIIKWECWVKKHIDIKFHFMKDVVARNLFDIVYCESEHMKADILTKSLPQNKFESLRNFLGIVQKNS